MHICVCTRISGLCKHILYNCNALGSVFMAQISYYVWDSVLYEQSSSASSYCVRELSLTRSSSTRTTTTSAWRMTSACSTSRPRSLWALTQAGNQGCQNFDMEWFEIDSKGYNTPGEIDLKRYDSPGRSWVSNPGEIDLLVYHTPGRLTCWGIMPWED